MTTRRGDARRAGRTARRARWKQARALLAGGLVLGIGASATVAAWTDTETGSGEFQAGAFLLEANIDGSWSSTRQMTFDAGAMYPGSVVYAPVRLRTSPDRKSTRLNSSHR